MNEHSSRKFITVFKNSLLLFSLRQKQMKESVSMSQIQAPEAAAGKKGSACVCHFKNLLY